MFQLFYFKLFHKTSLIILKIHNHLFNIFYEKHINKILYYIQKVNTTKIYNLKFENQIKDEETKYLGKGL